MRIKVTMADGKIITGERHWADVFSDGWSTTVLHDYLITDDKGIKLAEGKRAKIKNSWIVVEEEN